jgi:CRP/FNR family transcriptional regulator, cyclic AMP receptor protein
MWQDAPVATADPTMLKRTDLFSALNEEQSSRLVQAGETTEHAAGEELATEGVRGHRFRLILTGAAEVMRGGRYVATVGPGDFIGEVALLGGGTATATVRCTEPATCLTIWREAFWSVLEEEPAIALRILEVVCRRLARELQENPTANLGS